MIAENPSELATLRECGRRLAAILDQLSSLVRPGMATIELDQMAERLIREAGGDPVFKGYRSVPGERPFPAALCTSINHELVHGVPSRARVLRDGDIIGLDIGMRWPSKIQNSKFKIQNVGGGLITDTAVTVAVGNVPERVSELLRVTREALDRGIGVLRSGVHLGDLGHAIQGAIESYGFSVVRDLVGHGVGRQLHEDPYVPNYGAPGEGEPVREGAVLAVEPMAALGSPSVELAEDGWTWRTRDGSLAAHFEHTVVVTKDGAEVLTEL